MARTPKTYWEKRQTTLLKELEDNTRGTIDDLIKVYNKAQDNIQNEINKILKRYAINGKIDINEAKKLLNTRETKEQYDSMLEKIATIKDKQLKQELLNKYNAPAYAYRISRLEAIQDNIDVELAKLSQAELNVTREHYINTTKEAYYKTIFNVQQDVSFAFSFAKLDTGTLNLMLAEKWVDDKNFSDRIWKNKEKLGNYLKENLTAGITSGTSIQKMSKELAGTMNVGLYNATTLVRTETNYFANASEMLSYKECDIEKYQFIATLDQVTCGKCGELDKQIFLAKDAKPR